MLDLRIGENLVDRVDRTGGYAGLFEFLHPVRRGLLFGDFFERGVERGAIRGAVGELAELRMGLPLGLLAHVAETFVESSRARREIDVAVARREHAARRHRRMIVAGLLRDFALPEIARGLEVEQENLRLEERRVDPAADTRALAHVERRHDAEREEAPGDEIVHRNADAHRTASGYSGDRHEPAHALRDLVDSTF